MCKSPAVGCESFGEDRLFTTLPQSGNRTSGDSFRFCRLTFEQKRPSTSICGSCGATMVTNTDVECSRSCKVLMCLFESPNSCEEKTNVVFDTCQKTIVSSLLKMETGCREFN